MRKVAGYWVWFTGILVAANFLTYGVDKIVLEHNFSRGVTGIFLYPTMLVFAEIAGKKVMELDKEK